MQLRRFFIASSLLVVPSLGCDGDPEACTLVGCDNVGAITVAKPSGVLLPDATIEFELELDGATWLITCEPDEDTCEHDGPPEASLQMMTWRGSEGATIEFFGERDAMPDAYALRAAIEGEQVLEEAGTFEYSTSAPNGPDCGPICDSAAPLFFELPAQSE